MIGIIYIKQTKEQLDKEIDKVIALGLKDVKIFIETGANDFEYNIGIKLKYTFASKENAEDYFNKVDYYRGIPITYHFIELQKQYIKEISFDDVARKFGTQSKFLRII